MKCPPGTRNKYIFFWATKYNDVEICMQPDEKDACRRKGQPDDTDRFNKVVIESEKKDRYEAHKTPEEPESVRVTETPEVETTTTQKKDEKLEKENEV